MIVGTLNHCEKYYAMGEDIKKALEFLKTHDIRTMADGRYDLEGNVLSTDSVLNLNAKENQNIRILVQRYTTRTIDTCWFEGHLKYIDVHYVAEGSEYFCYTPIDRAGKPKTEYCQEEDDFLYDRDYETAVLMQPGDFAIVYPEDIHMPQRRALFPSNVVKACIKIAIPE